jgi:hypothetical protein
MREYGWPIALYERVVNQSNLLTGEKDVTRIVHNIRRAVVLPVKFESVAFYSAAYLKFARDFAYGGHQETETKRFIIYGKDLPKDTFIEPDHFIVYKEKRFEIKYVEQLEDKIGYQIIAVHLVGGNPEQILQKTIIDTLRITERNNYGP